MNIAQATPSTVNSISFSFLTSEDIRRISVKQIVNPTLLDDLNRPNIGGLYDPALGPSDRQDICATCRLTYFTCPGHYGHIELPSPAFHPLFMIDMYKLLRATCLYCHRFKMNRAKIIKYMAKLRLLDFGLLEACNALNDVSINLRKNSDENENAEGIDDESLADYEKRINLFVLLHLRLHPQRKRDDYKDGLVYQTRKQTIAEFMAGAMLKRCQNDGCQAHAHSLKKEGHTKIIELDLSTKMKAQHKMINLKRVDVLRIERKTRDVGFGLDGLGTDEFNIDSETEDENSDVDGDNTFSDGGDLYGKDKKGFPKTASGRAKTLRGRNERVMAPEECRAHLRRLFANEKVMCSLIFGRHGPLAPVNADSLSFASADMFFMECILVSPTRFRPPAKLGDTLFEHPQNELLSRVLVTSYRIRDLNDELQKASQKNSSVDDISRKRMLSALLESLIQLQSDVNSFIDSSKNPVRPRQGKLPPAGVKQNLEKKDGLFRMHMMGKRVNFAARSVISPDVNIEPNEIGIPPVFARKLTFPEPVTDHNVHVMRELVINGPEKYPGASIVEFEDGRQQFLDKLTIESRRALANQLLTPEALGFGSKTHLGTKTPAINKKVYRHLRDGDILLLNRQPTLHKPSMMAHKARVLHGEKTIRMHYANCNSYNADFDGDEMNIHFPQNEAARSEAMFIANTDNQYLVPTSGKPLRGLIQDHVVAGVWMTNKDTFFSRDEYFQLLYGSLRPEDDVEYSGRLRTLPPTIWKPKALWTGKQIISTILLNITPKAARGLNLSSKAKVAGDLWGKGSEEGKVLLMHGELLCGILDKSQFGATDYGLVHSVYELYGADVAGRLLGVLSRLFTKYLQHRAFTCRMDDLTLTPEGDKWRRDILRKDRNLGTEGAMENFPSLATTPSAEKKAALKALLQDVLRDDSKMAGLDVTVKQKLARLTKSIADACMPHGLQRRFPANNMQMMTQSGAKGSAVNAQQISCALGQQELEGRRVPVMVSGKTLPSFKAFETQAIAGGYVASRFLTGVKPQEFYFHCMAGREGLIDTAVKTSRSGYLQRCLIKHLEGIRVHYDHTVRGSDSSVFQFHYGGDSLDVTKQKHLYQFEFSARNEVSLLNRYKLKEVTGLVDEGEALSYMKKALKRLRDPSKASLTPTLSIYSPSRYLGSTSEKFAQKVDEYLKANPDELLKSKDTDSPPWLSKQSLIPGRRFRMLMNVKYMRSLVEPGEAVGLLASQGVGEPSTQMTLNTFHFAGHGAANVTLGIPRLREIVMTASTKPKTPSMVLWARPNVEENKIHSFCKQASCLRLSQVVDKVLVNEQLTETRQRRFVVTISFYPKKEYQEEYDVEPHEILASFATRFPGLLRKEIQIELKKLQSDLKSQLTDVGKGRAEAQTRGEDVGADDDGELPVADDVSEVGDGDAEDEKRARQSKQLATYESDDGDDADADVPGEYDDTAIEAEFAEEQEEGDEMDSDVSVLDDSLEVEIEKVRILFLEIVKLSTSFTFTENEVCFDLEFMPESPKLLLVGLLEKVCRRTIIREIAGISECFVSKEDSKGGKVKIVTNGSSYRGLWDFAQLFGADVLDLDSMYSNDIYSGLITYGVEMARAVILKEVQGVFSAYNIDVDMRHLELIADYMTFDGGFKPFNRKGISTNSSPLLKASFETTAAFISDATLHGDYDDLLTPSGNIVLGRPSLTGTGVFDIVQPLPC